MSQIRWRAFVGDAAATFLRQSAALALALVSSILLARLLGPEGKGLVALAVLLPSLISSFASLEIQASSMFLLRRRSHPEGLVLGNSLVLGVGLGLASLGVGLAISLAFADRFLPGVPLGLVLLGLLTVPAKLLWRYLDGILWGLDRIRLANGIALLEEGLRLGLILALVALLGWGVVGALTAHLAALMVMVGVGVAATLRGVRRVRYRLDVGYLREALSYSLRVLFSNALGFLNYRLDTFLVNLFLNPAAVGLYSVAVTLAERVWAISQAGGSVLFPEVSGMSEERDRRSFTPIVARSVLWLSVALGVVVVLLARPLVTVLYGRPFAAAVPALLWLVPGIVVGSVTRVVGNDLAARGRPLLNGYAGLVALVVNVLANVVLIPRYGIVGASLATTLSYSLDAVLRVALYWRLSGNAPHLVLLPQREDLDLYRRLLRIGLSRAAPRALS